MELDYRAIGVRVKEKRLRMGWTQEALAAAVGISVPHMSNVERGKTKVSLQTLVDIANALEATLDELVCDNLTKSKIIFEEKIAYELSRCNERDVKVVYDMVKALTKSLRVRGKSDPKGGSRDFGEGRTSE